MTNFTIPCWCITHKTTSYIGAPLVPTLLPGGDAMPLFASLKLAEDAITSMGNRSKEVESEEQKNPAEFVGFLKLISGLGIQYVALNPVPGKQCDAIFKIGVILAQFSSGAGKDFANLN